MFAGIGILIIRMQLDDQTLPDIDHLDQDQDQQLRLPRQLPATDECRDISDTAPAVLRVCMNDSER